MTERNFDVIQTPKGIIKAWTRGVEFEEQAKKQVESVLSLPFVKGVAVMPDVHAGMGCTVGSVIATQGAVVPSFVGVDLGCGMRASRTEFTRDAFNGLEETLFKQIDRLIPTGRTDNGGKNDRGRWASPPDIVKDVWDKHLSEGFEEIKQMEPSIMEGKGDRPTIVHLGTLGTGNHYIEVASDESGKVWLMLHSGSRGIGARIGKVYMDKAKVACNRWYINLESPDLAYLPHGTVEYSDYLKCLKWAQEFAFWNRRVMMHFVKIAVERTLGIEEFKTELEFDCHHNYASIENHHGQDVIVTRKGAVRARLYDWVIIPGSMGARSFIGKGLQNDDAFHSCSHGAGRRMSRGAAKKNISVADHVKATEGVTCLKDESVIDESPAAYKDVDAVINAEKDLFKPEFILKQFVNIKGKEESEKKR